MRSVGASPDAPPRSRGVPGRPASAGRETDRDRRGCKQQRLRCAVRTREDVSQLPRIQVDSPPEVARSADSSGIHNGSIVRLAGQGEPGMGGGPPGDFLLHIRLQPHPLFRVVDKNDLELELPVDPWEVALGAKAPVPTLDGTVEMKIPAATQGGQRLRLRGQGLNGPRGGRTDLYVKIKIVNPPALTPREKELFEQLTATSHSKRTGPLAGPH